MLLNHERVYAAIQQESCKYFPQRLPAFKRITTHKWPTFTAQEVDHNSRCGESSCKGNMERNWRIGKAKLLDLTF